MYNPVPNSEILEVPQEVQEMFDWASSRGIKWPKIIYPVRFPPGYIGSMATSEIFPNERIVTAPNSSLFTSQVARNCTELKAVFESSPETFSRPMMVLITFMIWEKSKGADSEWAPFIKYQPKNPSNLQDWSESELLELQDPDLEFDAKQRKEYHEYGWKHWHSALQKFPQFTSEMLSFEEYTWAFRVISTRSFGKFMPYVSLFPVGELLNHDNVQTYYIYQFNHENPDSSLRYSGVVNDIDHDDDLLTNDAILDSDTNALLDIIGQFNKGQKDENKLKNLKKLSEEFDKHSKKVAEERESYRPPDMDLTEDEGKEASICTGSNEHYLPGSEVYMSYGRYSNRQLLTSYGFALKSNHFNYARVKVLIKDLTIDPNLSEFLSKVNVFVAFKLKENILCEDLLQRIRSLHWHFDLSENNFLNPVDLSLESKVLETSINLLVQYLSKFQTTYEEDQLILSSPIADLRKYFAVLYRSQVKSSIVNQIKYQRVALEILNRMKTTHDLSSSTGLVAGVETESGNVYTDYSLNRIALKDYLSKLI